MTKRLGLSTSLFFGLCAILCALPCGAANLRTHTDISRPTIKLSDVFTDLPEGLDRDIATAPQPGRSVTYDISVLSRLTQQYRLDWQATNLSDKCVLSRTSTRITQDMIRRSIIDKIQEQADPSKNTQIDVVFDNRALEIHLPSDQAPTFTLHNFAYDNELRRFRADLVSGGNGLTTSTAVAGRVVVKRDVPVLSRRLESGSIIGDSDLTWVTMSVDRISPDMVTEAATLIGRETKRDLVENQPLRSRDVTQPRLVTRGSLVTMKIETATLQVTAQGRAMQDGSLGDTVRLTNTQSNRVIEGTVAGSGLVRIRTPENMAVAQATNARMN